MDKNELLPILEKLKAGEINIDDAMNSINTIENRSKKFVWLLDNQTKFSNSWDVETHGKFFSDDLLTMSKEKNSKLIVYECLNDKSFEFTTHMKLS